MKNVNVLHRREPRHRLRSDASDGLKRWSGVAAEHKGRNYDY